MVNIKDLLFRIFTFVCAALYLSMSIFRLCYAKEQYYIQNLLSIYFLIFTALIILFELKIKIVLRYCNFVDSPFKQGCFFLFCSILCFDIDEDFMQHYMKYSYSVGIITMFYAHVLFVFSIFFNDACKGEANPKISNDKGQQLPKISEEK